MTDCEVAFIQILDPTHDIPFQRCEIFVPSQYPSLKENEFNTSHKASPSPYHMSIQIVSRVNVVGPRREPLRHRTIELVLPAASRAYP